MNMRSLAFVIGVVGALGLACCKSSTSSGTAGASTGGGGAGTGGTAGAGGSTCSEEGDACGADEDCCSGLSCDSSNQCS